VFRPRNVLLARLGAFIASALLLGLLPPAFADVPLTTVSRDPYTNPSSYHRTEVEPDTFSFGSATVAAFQVGRFSDAGSDNLGWATTTDDGDSWTHGYLPLTTVYASPPGPWARISDPSVAYDAKDGVWMIAGLAVDDMVNGKAVLVSRSTDGGLSWGDPITVAIGGDRAFYDKGWISCDNFPTSPFYGTCYAQWDDNYEFSQLFMSRSTDGGLTWQSSTVPAASVDGGQPVSQRNGRVVVPISGAGDGRLLSFVSIDGGQTYTGPYPIATFQLRGPYGMRSGATLTSAAVDGAGRVFVAWFDCRFRPGCSADDIVFSTSTDGRHWSQVRRIPIATPSSPSEFFLPGIGVDHSTSGLTAHLGVTFYFLTDGTCDLNTCRLNAGFISSADGGRTWGAPLKLFGPISELALPYAGGYMVGDYISTSFGSDGRAYPVLASARGKSCQLGLISSCHEFMVAPVGGLAITGGRRLATAGPVFSGRGQPVVSPTHLL
jgi:hypothetical protein